MSGRHISIKSAEEDKLFYFVTTIVVFRESDQKCLILKRDERDDVYPGKWGLPGGRLSWGKFNLDQPDSRSDGVLNFNSPIEEHVKQVVRERAGIEVANKPQYLESVFFVRSDGTPSVLVRFAVAYKEGGVVPEHGFTDFAWVDAEEIGGYDHIEGIDTDILKTIKLYS
ncbi:MAG: hypothetical protein OQJ98_00160 [Candidatus Pacebacteria bacterium]|nr:hypothetical protein [Candidatus Paceibacterota bacterium]